MALTDGTYTQTVTTNNTRPFYGHTTSGYTNTTTPVPGMATGTLPGQVMGQTPGQIFMGGNQIQGAEPYVEGLLEIAEELGVEPGSGIGIFLQAKNGARYSFVAIMRAHLDLMKSLHILAVHTNQLTPETNE